MASFETRLRGKITLDSILIVAKILTVVSFELENASSWKDNPRFDPCRRQISDSGVFRNARNERFNERTFESYSENVTITRPVFQFEIRCIIQQHALLPFTG